MVVNAKFEKSNFSTTKTKPITVSSGHVEHPRDQESVSEEVLFAEGQLL